jgi:hypothetical protein
VLDRPAQQALADVQIVVLSVAMTVLQRCHARLERDVNDPPERQHACAGGNARTHA